MISIKENLLSQEELHCLQKTLYSNRFNWVEAQTNKQSHNSYYVHEFRHVNGIASP